MCDLPDPRFMSFYHQIDIDDPEAVPLDLWMENNIPDHYRVCSVMLREIGDTLNYHIFGERHG